jgi:outer membrane protein OmpA-like peptidoglycan-associated protein
MSKGVSTERIVAKGYGETQIINHCKNGVKCADDEHKQNRRTEFRIISGPTEIAVEEQVEDF